MSFFQIQANNSVILSYSGEASKSTGQTPAESKSAANAFASNPSSANLNRLCQASKTWYRPAIRFQIGTHQIPRSLYGPVKPADMESFSKSIQLCKKVVKNCMNTNGKGGFGFMQNGTDFSVQIAENPLNQLSFNAPQEGDAKVARAFIGYNYIPGDKGDQVFAQRGRYNSTFPNGDIVSVMAEECYCNGTWEGLTTRIISRFSMADRIRSPPITKEFDGPFILEMARGMKKPREFGEKSKLSEYIPEILDMIKYGKFNRESGCGYPYRQLKLSIFTDEHLDQLAEWGIKMKTRSIFEFQQIVQTYQGVYKEELETFHSKLPLCKTKDDAMAYIELDVEFFCLGLEKYGAKDMMNRNPGFRVCRWKNKLERMAIADLKTKARPYGEYPAVPNAVGQWYHNNSIKTMHFFESALSWSAVGVNLETHNRGEDFLNWLLLKRSDGIYLSVFGDDLVGIEVDGDNVSYHWYDLSGCDFCIGPTEVKVAIQVVKAAALLNGVKMAPWEHEILNLWYEMVINRIMNIGGQAYEMLRTMTSGVWGTSTIDGIAVQRWFRFAEFLYRARNKGKQPTFADLLQIMTREFRLEFKRADEARSNNAKDLEFLSHKFYDIVYDGQTRTLFNIPPEKVIQMLFSHKRDERLNSPEGCAAMLGRLLSAMFHAVPFKELHPPLMALWRAEKNANGNGVTNAMCADAFLDCIGHAGPREFTAEELRLFTDPDMDDMTRLRLGLPPRDRNSNTGANRDMVSQMANLLKDADGENVAYDAGGSDEDIDLSSLILGSANQEESSSSGTQPEEKHLEIDPIHRIKTVDNWADDPDDDTDNILASLEDQMVADMEKKAAPQIQVAKKFAEREFPSHAVPVAAVAVPAPPTEAELERAARKEAKREALHQATREKKKADKLAAREVERQKQSVLNTATDSLPVDRDDNQGAQSKYWKTRDGSPAMVEASSFEGEAAGPSRISQIQAKGANASILNTAGGSFLRAEISVANDEREADERASLIFQFDLEYEKLTTHKLEAGDWSEALHAATRFRSGGDQAKQLVLPWMEQVFCPAIDNSRGRKDIEEAMELVVFDMEVSAEETGKLDNNILAITKEVLVKNSQLFRPGKAFNWVFVIWKNEVVKAITARREAAKALQQDG